MTALIFWLFLIVDQKKRKKEKRNGQMYKLNSVLPIDIFVKNLMAVHYPVCKINSINKK